MLNTALKYFLYVRKSSESEDRQVASIEAQVDELKSLAKKLGIEIVDVFIESYSAKAPGRPVFNEMLQRIEKGETNGILCWKLDRLSRNPIDAGQIQWLLQRGIIQHIQTYQTSHRPTDNVLAMGVELGQANQFVLDLSVNVKRGNRKKFNDGLITGVAPAGYLNATDRERAVKTIVIDPERFPLVRKMWDLMLTGKYSVAKILEIANNEWLYRTVKRRKVGGKPLSRSGLYKIFTNPFYYGEFERVGVWYKGVYEPVITKAEFDRVQVLLGTKGRPRPQIREFAYTGLMRCGECLCLITAETKNQIICSICKNKFAYDNRNECPKCNIKIEEMIEPKILNYIYYHCTKQKPGYKCSQGGLEVKQLETQIKDYLGRIEIKQKYLDWALEYLKEENQTEAETSEVIVDNYQKEYKKTSKQLEVLLEMRLNEEVGTEEFQAKKDQLSKEKERIRELLNQADHDFNGRIEKCEQFFQFCHIAVKKFEEAKINKDLQAQKAILSTLGSNLIVKDKMLQIEPLIPFRILEKGLELVPEAKAIFEPKKSIVDKSKSTAFDHASTHWLGREDSNL